MCLRVGMTPSRHLIVAPFRVPDICVAEILFGLVCLTAWFVMTAPRVASGGICSCLCLWVCHHERSEGSVVVFCLGVCHPNAEHRGGEVSAVAFALCPRFASFCWTLTWDFPESGAQKKKPRLALSFFHRRFGTNVPSAEFHYALLLAASRS